MVRVETKKDRDLIFFWLFNLFIVAWTWWKCSFRCLLLLIWVDSWFRLLRCNFSWLDFCLSFPQHLFGLKIDDFTGSRDVLLLLDKWKHLVILEQGGSDIFVDHAVTERCSDQQVDLRYFALLLLYVTERMLNRLHLHLTVERMLLRDRIQETSLNRLSGTLLEVWIWDTLQAHTFVDEFLSLVSLLHHLTIERLCVEWFVLRVKPVWPEHGLLILLYWLIE